MDKENGCDVFLRTAKKNVSYVIKTYVYFEQSFASSVLKI